MRNRENAFDFLNDDLSGVFRKEEYKIPESLIRDSKEKKKTNSDIMIFEYDIPNKCFYFKGYQEPRSVFFEIHRNCNEESNLTKDFLIVKISEKKEEESIMVRDQVIASVLEQGVVYNKTKYEIVGCSNSQVQKKSFVFGKISLGGDRLVETYIPGIKELEKQKGVAKRVKYAGLLFTGCRYMLELPDDFQVEDARETYMSNGFDFTDGCGIISLGLAKEIVKKNKKLQKDWKGNIPSVWQIRYYGITKKTYFSTEAHLCKGVLIVDYGDESTRITFRSSMKKVPVSTSLGRYFGIVETSMNPKLGKLNKQFVTLMSKTIDEEDMLNLYRDYLKTISKCRHDASAAFEGSLLVRMSNLFKDLIKKYGFKDIMPMQYTNLVQAVESSFISSWTKGSKSGGVKERIQIPLLESRLVFGAALPEYLHLHLDEGQCVMFHENGYYEGPVIVSRSPSYHPGDIRILDAVKPPAREKRDRLTLDRMKNVIFFATKGLRPDPDKMSGGDLDGDQYLVMWHKTLIEKYSEEIRKTPPISYTVDLSQKRNHHHRQTNWKTYVAIWENSILPEIDSCFYELAEEFGIDSQQCNELCKIFSRAVDNIPADVKRLREISFRCSRPSKSKSSNYSSGKPIWAKLTTRGLDILEELTGEKQNRFPVSKDWEHFHKSLVYRNKTDLEKLFYSPVVHEFLGDHEVMILKREWSRILKTSPVQVEAVEDAIECVFDCVDLDCINRHNINPEFYKAKWMKRLIHELSPLAQNIRDKRRKIEAELHLFDQLANLNKKRERECDKELSAKIHTHMMLKTYMETAEVTYGHIREMTSAIEDLQRKYNSLPFWDSGERQLKAIHEREELLVKLHKRMALDINELAYISNQRGILVVLIDQIQVGNLEIGTASVNIGERICNDCERIVKRAHDHWKAVYPKKEISQTNVENIDRLVAISRDKIEQLQGKICNAEEDIRKTNLEIEALDKEQTKKVKVIKEYETQEILLAKMETETDASCILESLLNESNSIWNFCSDSERQTFINLFLRSGNFRHDRDYNLFLATVRKGEKEKQRKIESTNKERVSLSKQIEQKMNHHSMRENQIKTMKNQIQTHEEEIKNLKEKRGKVYDEEKHKSKNEEYNGEEWIIEQLAGFDLAISALENEIETAFNFSEGTQQLGDSKFRVATTEALKLSFRRETIRCHRDKTEHNLPVFRKRFSILDSLRQHDAVIVVAHTGSGKSTQVPQYLADDLHHILSIDGNKFAKVACTQPRRVACIRIAERVSQEYAGAVPIPTGQAFQKKKIVYGDTRVSAYPLFAKLSQVDQDRALDTEDRVGYDRDPPAKQREDSTQASPSSSDGLDLSGTPGVLGEWVGYHIGSKGKTCDEKKNSKKFNRDTRIHFVTEGLLLQKLKGSRDSSYSCIIVDEAHERGRDTDLLLAHLHDIVKNSKNTAYKGNNLKVVVMSASINAEQFSRYFNNCPIVECQGKMHEVTCDYLPPSEPINEDGEGGKSSKPENGPRQDSDYDSSWEDEEVKGKQQGTKDELKKEPEQIKPSDMMKILIQHVVDTIFTKVLTRGGGDILVFLPGQSEIYQCTDEINKRAREEKEIKGGFATKKVVCCTNIAETSLTIPGVTYVLDAGKAKKIQYDNTLRISALELTDISQASAKQRKGRAGRVEPGHCIRLYSEDHHDKEMIPFDIPEMKQMPIDELYLYSIDVFKGLEEIELMEDAQPDKEAIDSAKKRLLNLEYLDKDESERLMISAEGRFALSLVGDVTLEGAKMIIGAKGYLECYEGVVCDAIKLAVLLEENIYTESATNEERAKYTHELGDHLTIFNLYRHFEDKMKNLQGSKARRENQTRKWCEQLGLNYGTLDQMKKLFDRVYQNIKKDNLCNIGSLVKDAHKNEQKERNNKDFSRKRKMKLLQEYDIVKHPTTLMKLVVAGYFHNICTYNDSKFMNAGYSLLTPTNYGDISAEDPSRDATILKLRLNRDSNMREHGDFVESTAAIFRTLFKPPRSESVFMITSSRIKPEWVEECASKRWATSINLKIQGDSIQSLVKTYQIPHIGIPIMCKIRKEKIKEETKKGDGMKWIDWMEKESNARIQLFFDTAEIKVYGSKKEISRAVYDSKKEICTAVETEEGILTIVKRFKNEMINTDSSAKYPKGEDKQEICKIKSGLLITKEAVPRSIISRNLNEFQSGVLVLSDKESNALTKEAINRMLNSLKERISSNELLKAWVLPEIIFCSGKLAKVNFQRLDIALEYNRLLSDRQTRNQFFPNSTSCFLDSEIELRVIDTSLFPSVSESVDQFQFLTCRVNNAGNIFRIGMEKKIDRNQRNQAKYEMDTLMETLATKKTFGSELIELVGEKTKQKDLTKDSFQLRYGEKAFIFWKIDNMVKMSNFKGVLIRIKKYPSMVFEIFGEHRERTLAAYNIKNEITRLKQVLKKKSTEVYNERVPMQEFNSLGSVLQAVKNINKEFDSVTIAVKFDGTGRDNVLPVVHIISDKATEGKDAYDRIKREMAGTKPTGDFKHRCSMCQKGINLPKSSKKKIEEAKEAKEARQNGGGSSGDKIRLKHDNNADLAEGIRLGLCGCLFCKKCFELYITEKLEYQGDENVHEPMNCPKCQQNLLIVKDVERMTYKAKEKIYERVFLNFLSSRLQPSERFDKCGNCHSYYVINCNENGVFRCYNNKCRFLFCTVCKKRVMSNNKLDFNEHVKCWNANLYGLRR